MKFGYDVQVSCSAATLGPQCDAGCGEPVVSGYFWYFFWF
jgi:hypothetical protein